MKREVTREVKVMWLSRMFYGVSHTFDFDINPYDDLLKFMNSQTGTLNWGDNKKEAKERLARKYHLLLELYGIRLPIKYIMEGLNVENQLNKVMVEHWAEHSEFPSKW